MSSHSMLNRQDSTPPASLRAVRLSLARETAPCTEARRLSSCVILRNAHLIVTEARMFYCTWKGLRLHSEAPRLH